MMQPPIVVAGVWKRFRRGRRADTLREVVPSLVQAIVHPRRRGGRNADSFWALRDVSLSVAPGEVLGVIGPNGAGKSTLLGILSGIFAPDRGAVQVQGRIGALIELAAGFHPDLTGRENVFLQGAILGMRRAEIARRFDEIVEFAGVADFIDTPIKHYSSGMNARLGFALAAHLDPDVLLIDEVLAVGDRAFQQKAFGRLAMLVERNVAVVVVSHQLERVSTFCHRAILLAEGAVAFEGAAAECVARYIEGAHAHDTRRNANCPVTIDRLDLAGGECERQAGDRITIQLKGTLRRQPTNDLEIGIRVWSVPAEEIIATPSELASVLGLPSEGPFAVDITLSLNLGKGVYRLQGVAWDGPTQSEWTRGPSVLVSVNYHGAFGRVWLDPRLERSAP